MGYIDHVLEAGETVRYRGKLSFIAAAPRPLLILILFLVSLYFALDRSGAVQVVLSIVATVLFIWLVVTLVLIGIRRATTEIAVTDRRVVIKVGLFERRTIEMNLTRIESVDVRQGVFGRLFNYGDVVLRGTGAGQEPMDKIHDPLGFRRSVITGQS